MSVSGPSSAQLAVLYEHPQWFQPLFAALERHCLPHDPGEVKANGRIVEHGESALHLFLIPTSPQAEEVERFTAHVIEPMRPRTPELV